MQPIFLQRLLSFFTPGTTITLSEAYGYAGGIILCTVLSVLIMNPFWMAILHIGMKLRVACCSLVYRKVLHFIYNIILCSQYLSLIHIQMCIRDREYTGLQLTYRLSLWLQPHVQQMKVCELAGNYSGSLVLYHSYPCFIYTEYF